MSDWKHYAYKATVDLTAAHLGRNHADALAHLKDARENVQRAIEAIEAMEDGD